MTDKPEVNVSDPKKLLQEQVMLLNELNNRAASIQKTQEQLEQRVADLARIAPVEANSPTAGWAEVFVKNLDMPFFSMVRFMIKWTIASIPAAIIVGLLVGLVIFLGALLLGGMGGLIAWLSTLGR